MRYIVITGASKGIGRGIASSFAISKNEYAFALTYNTDLQGVNEVALKLTQKGFFVILVKMDISNPEDVKNGFEYIYKCFPKVDLLINNAGISITKPFFDTTIEDWDKIINVNLKGAFLTTKQVIDKMNYDGGVILNITSIWGEVGASCEVVYSCSKAGLIGLTKALNKEYENVRLKAISVGFVDTNMNKHLTKEDIQTFLIENPSVTFKTITQVGEEIKQIAIAELNKAENNDFNNDDNEDIIIRIW